MPCSRANRRIAACLLLVVSLTPGCAHLCPALRTPGPFAYFTAPVLDDPWSAKISGWQSRERAAQADVAEAAREVRDFPPRAAPRAGA
jgi:hypothetical protein